MGGSVSAGDLIGVVETAYDLAGDDAAWCERLACTVSSALNAPFGSLVWVYDLGRDGSFELFASGGCGFASTLGTLAAALPTANPGSVQAVFATGGPVVCLGEAVGGRPAERFAPWPRDVFDPAGVEDNLGIFGLNPGASVVALLAYGKLVSLSAAERQVYSMLATHMSAGIRLRRALATRGGDAHASLDDADVVLEGDGRVAHVAASADSPARIESLRLAAKAVDKARGQLRRSDATEALSIWRGLAAGRYSLVDHFESDGRRYVVARRNEPGVSDPRRLTPRERQIAYYASLGYANKLIGYTLGLSTSTVGTHLASAMRKLGVRRKTELAASIIGNLDGHDA